MRFFLVVFILSAGLAGCKKEKELSPFDFPSGSFNQSNLAIGSSFPFGKYHLLAYENGVSIPYEIDIEFKNEINSKGDFILSGKSCVNFYFATYEFNLLAHEIKIKDLALTKIAGDADKLAFERTFLEKISEVEKFEVLNDGETLVLYLPESNNQYLIFVSENK